MKLGQDYSRIGMNSSLRLLVDYLGRRDIATFARSQFAARCILQWNYIPTLSKDWIKGIVRTS